MKKVLKKASKTLIIVMLLLIITLNNVQAASITKEKVYEIDYCEKVLKYQGVARGAVYVVYEEDGQQYPAYCINPERIGVGETDSYEVNVDGYITDVMLWRIITNGYPYKTIGELGVANEKEAYLATKQAIYCYLDNRDVNAYSGIGEAGQRTLNALKQIWNNAQKSTETKISNTIDIIPISSEWEIDSSNPEYISKTYRVEAPETIVVCDIKINGESLPEGLIIADIDNNVRDSFMPYEQFKILIPTSSLKREGNFEIKIDTKMHTKPVLYGVSPNSELQNYALTAFSYEDASGIYLEKYPKNEAQIKILKLETNTKKPLENVEFQLLNSQKEVIRQSIITGANGEVTIDCIAPGTYYLKEVKTLPGYVLYDEEIKIEIDLNEQVNVKVNNSKEKKIEITKEFTNIEVGAQKENIEIEKNKENIEKQQKEENIKIKNTEKNTEIKETEKNIEIELTKENLKEIKKEINIKRLPKTGM